MKTFHLCSGISSCDQCGLKCVTIIRQLSYKQQKVRQSEILNSPKVKYVLVISEFISDIDRP